MAQLLRMLSVAPRAIRELRVDSILLQAGVKKHKGIQDAILKTTWKDHQAIKAICLKAPREPGRSSEGPAPAGSGSRGTPGQFLAG